MSPDAPALTTEILPGVSALPEADWTALYPDEAEGWAYYRACEERPPAGVSLSAVCLSDGSGVVAACPLFTLSYRLDTPLQGQLRHLAELLRRRFPGLVEWRLLGIGSPFTDRCHVGLRPGLGDGERDRVLRALVAAVEQEAARTGAQLIAFKDLVGAEHTQLRPAAMAAGFVELRSLPIATLGVPDGDIDAYVATLTRGMRKDVRRKLRGDAAVRVERRHDIRDLAPSIGALYESTRAHSTLAYGAFEELPGNYFDFVSRWLSDRVVFMLYWIGGELAAFNMLLLEPDRVIDKFLGMRYPLARQHDLYVRSWIENVRLCQETGRHWLQSGQTAYASKVRLGSVLTPAWIAVKHRNRALNGLVRLAAPLLSFDRWDPDLRRIRAGEMRP